MQFPLHSRLSRVLLPAVVLATALAGAPGSAAGQQPADTPLGAGVALLHAPALQVVRPTALLRADRGAIGGSALVMEGRGAAVGVLRDVAARRLLVRARRGRCRAPVTLLVRLDGRRVLRRVLRGARWRTLRARVRASGGDHEVGISVGGRRRGCRPELRVDRIELRTAQRPVPVGSALRWSEISEDRYRDTFLRQFDSLTPENEMKMNTVRPRQTTYAFSTADQMVDFAQRTGKVVHGHALVFGAQLPLWLTGRVWTRGSLLDVMREHVAAMASHFRGRVAEWDVINEPFAADGTLARNIWSHYIGPAYIEEALSAAHDADPRARLYINESGAELSDAKFEGLLALAKDLRSRGVPLHGIGLQNHVNLELFPTRASLAERMRRIEALGLEVQVTEMDVSTTSRGGPLEGRLARQAEIYAESAAACNEVPACKRFTVWGVDDRHTWIGTEQRPLLFDSSYAAKPALDAVRSAFAPR